MLQGVLDVPDLNPQIAQLIENRQRRLDIREKSVKRRLDQIQVLVNPGKYLDVTGLRRLGENGGYGSVGASIGSRNVSSTTRTRAQT